jgi:hypothetical protein
MRRRPKCLHEHLLTAAIDCHADALWRIPVERVGGNFGISDMERIKAEFYEHHIDST